MSAALSGAAVAHPAVQPRAVSQKGWSCQRGAGSVRSLPSRGPQDRPAQRDRGLHRRDQGCAGSRAASP
ncbi:MAG: hypothetical protein NZ890_17955 [Myxococcota bacterium]|nr:hypothetical protein [Myxococcota bacterium]